MFSWGLFLMTLGMFQKVVLADTLLAPAAETVFSWSQGPLATLDAWLGVLAFSGQIFFDFAGMDEHRQVRMWDRCDFDTDRAKLIQQTWVPLFTPPPPPPHLSPEEFGEMMKKNTEAYLERIRVAVDKVRGHGGRVVFVRPPSTGRIRELEQQFAPREQTWDLMLQVTGAPGIHFEDHPELAAFDCPEWSHLTAADAVGWTQALMPMLEKALSGS
jgi:hypothetical protein